MSIYAAYPAYRPQRTSFGGYGAILGSLGTFVPAWRQKVMALRTQVAAFADAIQQQVVGGQDKAFIMDMVKDATTALASAMNWLNTRVGGMWGSDDEARLMEWYGEADASYQGAIRVVETSDLSFLRPKDKVSIPGVAFVGGAIPVVTPPPTTPPPTMPTTPTITTPPTPEPRSGNGVLPHKMSMRTMLLAGGGIALAVGAVAFFATRR